MRILPAETPFAGVPYEGCAATIPCGSDSYPGTVSKVSESKVLDTRSGLTYPTKIWVRSCGYKIIRGSGQDGSAEYVYFEDDDHPPNEIGQAYTYRLQRGGYVQVGTRSSSTAAWRLAFGHRRAYRDPSF